MLRTSRRAARSTSQPSATTIQNPEIGMATALRTPRDVSAFIEEVRRAQLRAAVSRSIGRFLREGGRRLLEGTRALKADLRLLQRGASTARSGRPGRRPRSRG